MIGPAFPLSILVGVFHAALLVAVRGRAGGGIPLVGVAAILGAWAGDALAGRIGFDLLAVGDYRLAGASLGAWAGIAVALAIEVLGPDRRPFRRRRR
ncbi:MAG: hypothetical protein RL338_28 [Chloroflexota bacterium]|jgi:hypothetical protein